MTLQEYDILQLLLNKHVDTQRQIAIDMNLSIGLVNRSLKVLEQENLIDSAYRPTKKGYLLAKKSKSERAIILAAGYGMRMMPINNECPKGLLEVRGEVLIERTIRQLKETGINEIYVVVGFMKERYEYLAEKFDVNILFCNDYPTKNNLYSLAVAKDHLKNAYIIPCDLYCINNPFNSFEFYSWYMVSTEKTKDTDIRVTRSREIQFIDEGSIGNVVFGISYINANDAASLKKKITEMTSSGRNSTSYWESAICNKKSMLLLARITDSESIIEINTYQQLREIEYYNPILQNDVIRTIQNVFNVSYEDITDVHALKKGLTNRSLLFAIHGKKYIMRIPGEGTDAFINRHAEFATYQKIAGKGICEDNIYFDPEKGFKISRYIENSRVCNDNDPIEVKECLQIVRKFHELKLTSEVKFNLFEAIEYFESLWGGTPSMYKDYEEVKTHCMAMQPFVEKHAFPAVLSHGDCNPDNFLIHYDENGKKIIDFIDWEYSAMQDPLTDLAAFITYRMRDRDFTEQVINDYFTEGCPIETRLLIYCYVALWGLYNSNWCEYKLSLGVELGDFSITEYRYAKQYYKIFEEEYKKLLEDQGDAMK